MFASDPAYSYSKLHLPKGEESKERVIACMVNYWQGQRLEIIMAERIAPGTAVSVEHEDAFLLGEVASNVAQAHLWRIHIHVQHVLHGLINLMEVRAKLLGESPECVEVATPA